jgi:hypothetical protein
MTYAFKQSIQNRRILSSVLFRLLLGAGVALTYSTQLDLY